MGLPVRLSDTVRLRRLLPTEDLAAAVESEAALRTSVRRLRSRLAARSRNWSRSRLMSRRLGTAWPPTLPALLTADRGRPARTPRGRLLLR